MFKFITATFSREVLGSKSVSLAFVAFALAVLIASVAYFIFAFTNGSADKSGDFLRFVAPSSSFQILVFVVFLFAFVLIWFLLYLQYNREAEDIYSRLREKLAGNWQIRYELYPDQNRYAPYDKVPSVPCKIAVNEATKKLEILFEIDDDPLFENGKQTIRTIALRHEADNRYSMSYYYKMSCGLNTNLSQHLLNEKGDGTRTDLEVEIFASLNFEDPLSKSEVDRMSGEWFDLNGNLIRLFSLVSELKEHQKDDKIFKRKLSEAVVTRDNFAASMGDIIFFR
jgi:hypothetical protein